MPGISKDTLDSSGEAVHGSSSSGHTSDFQKPRAEHSTNSISSSPNAFQHENSRLPTSMLLMSMTITYLLPDIQSQVKEDDHHSFHQSLTEWLLTAELKMLLLKDVEVLLLMVNKDDQVLHQLSLSI